MSSAVVDTDLTAEQKAVVDSAATTFLLVTAGAGAGKTHTMISRIVRLLRDRELDPHEILILGFARSTVRELTARLDATDPEARFVPVRTFDAYALELLLDGESDVDWTAEPFDDRIGAAADLVADGHCDALLDDVAHLVVDEAQDLVGVRLAFVEAILDRTGCAFTVVGDIAQSIYGFQLKDDPERRLRSADECFRSIRETYGDDLVEVELTGNFRAHEDEARIALPFGPKLRTAPADPTREIYEDLRSDLMLVQTIGSPDDDWALLGLYDESMTTAVLCRYNAEALLISERLHEAGVPHRLRRTAQDRVAPSWLAGLFRAHPGTTLKQEQLTELLPDVPGAAGQDTEQVWRRLRRVAADRGRAVDMDRLRDAIARRRLPDEFTAQPEAAVVVSSFHRAKGLEFDRVVVLDPGPRRADVPDQEEARLLYVAMTRPRRELWRIDPLPRHGARKWDRGERVGRYGSGKWRNSHFGLEMSGGDVAVDEPAGPPAPPMQDRLLLDVGVGDVVELRTDGFSRAERTGPIYRVIHEGVDIGRTSECFSTDLFRFLGGNRRYTPPRYPLRITGVRIDAIETVAGSVAAGRSAGLGDRGIWLAPRLGGLSRFDWKATA